MRTTKHAPRGPCHFLEHPHALADIVQRGAVGAVLTVYAKTLYMDKGNISELMEASMVLEDAEKVARRVLGPAHPLTVEMGNDMKRVGERMDELAALAIAHSKNPSSSAGRAVKTFSLDQLSGLIDKLAMDSPALKK